MKRDLVSECPRCKEKLAATRSRNRTFVTNEK